MDIPSPLSQPGKRKCDAPFSPGTGFSTRMFKHSYDVKCFQKKILATVNAFVVRV